LVKINRREAFEVSPFSSAEIFDGPLSLTFVEINYVQFKNCGEHYVTFYDF